MISNLEIAGTCPPTTNVVVYTLTSLPANGQLFLNGVALGLGDTFTQTDVDNNLLTYVHNGQNTNPDQFSFTAYCPSGGYTGGLVFPITITPMVGLDAVQLIDFSIYPNPANASFHINVLGEVGESYSYRLVDMMGRVLDQQILQGEETILRDPQLAAGVYSCQIWKGTMLVGERKLVIMQTGR